jgi:hypothetical protein
MLYIPTRCEDVIEHEAHDGPRQERCPDLELLQCGVGGDESIRWIVGRGRSDTDDMGDKAAFRFL